MKRNQVMTIWLAILTLIPQAFAQQGSGNADGSIVQVVKRPLVLDVKARRIELEAKVCRREGVLEFLVCLEGTKEHESILHTQVSPSSVHAALLALGLTQGKPARWRQGVGGEGQFIPPQGPILTIRLEWLGKDDKICNVSAGTWLKLVGENKTPLPDKWVFVGSKILPNNRYLADMNGELISVANFASSVIDVPFESSDKDAFREFQANTAQIPPLGTSVRVIIQPVKGAKKSPHARVLLEVDRFGRYRIDGQPVARSDLRRWAQQFVARHPKAMVVIRPDAQTTIYDLEHAREEVSLGGITEVEEERVVTRGTVLPRTPEDAYQQLKQIAEQLGGGEETLGDPVEEAQDILRRIDRELAVMEQTKTLWEDYAAKLREALKKQADKAKLPISTQPSSQGAETEANR